MGCQKAIAAEIVKAQADYVLSLKTNHRHLCLQVASWFDKSLTENFVHQTHSHYVLAPGVPSYGRIESREHWLIEVPEHLKRATKYRANLQTICSEKIDPKTRLLCRQR